MQLGDLVKKRIAFKNHQNVLGETVGTIVKFETKFDGERDIVKEIKVSWRDGTSEAFTSDYDLEVVTPELYVNVYLHDRECVGHEDEGYYDTYEPVLEMCQRWDSEEQAQEKYDEMRKTLAEMNKGRPKVSSVLSEGIYIVRMEAYPARSYPEYAPLP